MVMDNKNIPIKYYQFNKDSVKCFKLYVDDIDNLTCGCKKYNIFRYINNELGIIVKYEKTIITFVFLINGRVAYTIKNRSSYKKFLLQGELYLTEIKITKTEVLKSLIRYCEDFVEVI